MEELSSDQSKRYGSTKKVRVKIAEGQISHQFFLRVLKSLLEHHHEFGKDFMVHSPLGDAMVAKIRRNDHEIVIATGGEEDSNIYIKGDQQFVREFVEYLAVEASTLIALEFCSSLENWCTSFSPEKMREALRVKIKEALDEVLT